VLDSPALYALGVAVIFVGVLVIVVAVVLLSVSGAGKIKGGGVIIIGPVPIIFGTDTKSLKTVLLFSLAPTVMVALVLYYLLLR